MHLLETSVRRQRPGPRRAPGVTVAVALLAASCQFGVSPSGGSANPGASGSSGPGRTGAGATIAASPGATPLSSADAAGRIVFIRFEPAKHFFVIHTIRPDGSEIRDPLPGYPLGFGLVRWSADGSRIMAQSTSTDGFETIIPPDPNKHHHLYLADPKFRFACSAWSPTLEVLACEGWSTTEPGKEGIYTVRVADGGDVRRLTSTVDGIHDIPGDYSPDGSKLLFVRATRVPELLGQLWVCDADGGNATHITDALSGYRVSWSPDGRWIAGTRRGSILVFDMQHLNQEPLIIGVANGTAAGPRWAPDSQHIVFQFTDSVTHATRLEIIDSQGLDRRQLTAGPDDESPDWGVPGF